MHQHTTRPLRIRRLPHLRDTIGLGTTAIYERIDDGRITPPVRLTPRSVGWPEHEIDAIVGAMIAGQSDDDLRKLVRDLVEQRRTLATSVRAG